MRRRDGATLAVAAMLAIGQTRGIGQRTALDGYELEVMFDGGYVYHLNARDFVEVKTLTNGRHPMRVRLTRGSVASGAISEFRLSDGKLELLPDGTAPSRVRPTLPPYDSTQTGCNEVVDKAKPNNLLFLPNLGTVASEMNTKLKRGKSPEKPEKAGSIILTGGGALSIKDLGGCVQFKRPDGTPFGEKRSMANGIGGIHYNWRLDSATSLTLRITELDDSRSVHDIAVKPDRGVIQLRVGSFDEPTSVNVNDEIRHFRTHFDDAFENVPASKRITLWWLQRYEVSPGIDCPSGGDPDSWPPI